MSDFKMDMTPLSKEQMEVMKKMIGFCQVFAGQIKDIMVHHHLWHKGFTVNLQIDPRLETITESVAVKRKVVDGEGIYEEGIERFRGTHKIFNEWRTLGCETSREFIHLFDGEKDGEGSPERKADEKPLPPNGLWIGADPNSDPVDGGQ